MPELSDEAWLAEALAENTWMAVTRGRCEGCGVEVVRIDSPGRSARRLACSAACRLELARRARRRPSVKATCSACGARFTPSRADARYCSHACRQAAYRARRAS